MNGNKEVVPQLHVCNHDDDDDGRRGDACQRPPGPGTSLRIQNMNANKEVVPRLHACNRDDDDDGRGVDASRRPPCPR